jgi:hypothetical protein
MFLILMVVGLAGLGVMALPALGRHGAVGHGAHALHAGHANAGKLVVHSDTTALTRFVPSPRLVLSLLALFGAFANVFVAAHFAMWSAALLAIVPAVLVERFALAPIWRSLFKLELQASGPLAEIVMSEATAVTPFRGGRGVVSVVREGRLVQFSARLIEAHTSLPVRVGDRLRIEDVESARERVTVSVVGGSA